MRAPTVRSTILAAALAVVGCSLAEAASGQDPGRDLPAQRVPGITKGEAMRLGIERLRAGWNWEAARMFRELLVLDDTQPLPHLLLALAFRNQPNRAARHCYDAVTRREQADAVGKRLVDAYQAYFGVTDQPELNDARFAKVPGKARYEQLHKALLAIYSEGGAGRWVIKLVGLGTEWLPPSPKDIPSEGGDRIALAAHHSYLGQRGLLPFMVPGYQQLLESSQAFDHDLLGRRMARLPRHPQYPAAGRPVPGLPGLKLDGAAQTEAVWRPRVAKSFTLPRGVGGTGKFSDYEGKPVLVVFFLGFGCAHCVAQLADLDPKASKFRDAGIEVVSIGTDDLNAVKAARQAADENGVDPLHFDVLCDPSHKVFKQWGVWDEFSNEALHGTFLVDGKGRILWQDISVRPFEESDWLLAESKRLLAAWK